MLKCGLIDGVLPHLKVDLAAVQFKLLGTLRMIIDGQGEVIGWFFKPCLFVSAFLQIVLNRSFIFLNIMVIFFFIC